MTTEVLMSKVVVVSDLWGIGGRAWLDGMGRNIVDKGTHWHI